MAAEQEAPAAAGEEPCCIAWVWSPAAAAEYKRKQNSSKHRREVARYKKRWKEFERLGKRWTIYVVLAAVFVLAALCLRHRSSCAARVCVVMAAGWMIGVAKVTARLRRVSRFLRRDVFSSDYHEAWE